MLDKDTPFTKQVRVLQTKTREVNKVSSLSREDDAEIENTDDLLVKIEGDIQTYEESEKEQEGLEEGERVYSVKRIEHHDEEKWYQSSTDSTEEEDRYGIDMEEDRYSIEVAEKTFYTRGVKG